MLRVDSALLGVVRAFELVESEDGTSVEEDLLVGEDILVDVLVEEDTLVKEDLLVEDILVEDILVDALVDALVEEDILAEEGDRVLLGPLDKVPEDAGEAFEELEEEALAVELLLGNLDVLAEDADRADVTVTVVVKDLTVVVVVTREMLTQEHFE